jgi:hypothetical protein
LARSLDFAPIQSNRQKQLAKGKLMFLCFGYSKVYTPLQRPLRAFAGHYANRKSAASPFVSVTCSSLLEGLLPHFADYI